MRFTVFRSPPRGGSSAIFPFFSMVGNFSVSFILRAGLVGAHADFVGPAEGLDRLQKGAVEQRHIALRL